MCMSYLGPTMCSVLWIGTILAFWGTFFHSRNRIFSPFTASPCLHSCLTNRLINSMTWDIKKQKCQKEEILLEIYIWHFFRFSLDFLSLGKNDILTKNRLTLRKKSLFFIKSNFSLSNCMFFLSLCECWYGSKVLKILRSFCCFSWLFEKKKLQIPFLFFSRCTLPTCPSFCVFRICNLISQ